MLMRSSLLRRYPNAVIYATPAIVANGTRTPSLVEADELMPAFRGSMQPDLSFFGFDITTDAATGKGGTPGYYIVIQEHPTEPRFGLDAGTPAGAGTTQHRVAAGRRPGCPGSAAMGSQCRPHGRHRSAPAGAHRDPRVDVRQVRLRRTDMATIKRPPLFKTE